MPPGQGQPRTGADRDAYFSQKIAALEAKVGLHENNAAAVQSQIQNLNAQLAIAQRQIAELVLTQKSSTT